MLLILLNYDITHDDGIWINFSIEISSPKMANMQTRNLDPQEDGCVVDMAHVDAGNAMYIFSLNGIDAPCW